MSNFRFIDCDVDVSKILKQLNDNQEDWNYISNLQGKDNMGLPEKIMVCPAYGLDGFAMYKKHTDYSAPEW